MNDSIHVGIIKSSISDIRFTDMKIMCEEQPTFTLTVRVVDNPNPSEKNVLTMENTVIQNERNFEGAVKGMRIRYQRVLQISGGSLPGGIVKPGETPFYPQTYPGMMPG
jgi:hypothetical protein